MNTSPQQQQPQGSPSAHQGRRMETKPLHIMRRFELFDLWLENWRSHPRDSWTKMHVYRTKSGDMIDCRHRGKRPGLIKKLARLRITAEKRSPDHAGCSIGRSAVDGKWYGWSHRALVGFGLGDAIFDETWGLCPVCAAEGEPGHSSKCDVPACEGGLCAELSGMAFVRRGGELIMNDADAKKAASNFAASVS